MKKTAVSRTSDTTENVMCNGYRSFMFSFVFTRMSHV